MAIPKKKAQEIVSCASPGVKGSASYFVEPALSGAELDKDPGGALALISLITPSVRSLSPLE